MEKETNVSRIREVIRFLISGIVCFTVELLLLVLLKELLLIDTLVATPIAFLASVAVNYIMCVTWVFEGINSGGRATQIGFLLTSVMGLFFNELLMLAFRFLLGEEEVIFTLFGFDVSMYVINKVLATLLVMIWNFFTKRAMLQTDWIKKNQK